MYYTEDEFSSKIIKDGTVVKTTSESISRDFNADVFKPIDGELIRACDHLSAFVEAFKSVDAGFSTRELQDGLNGVRAMYKNKTVAGIRIDSIYKDFSD
jgi:putative hydrolase of HD superfamily